MEIQRLCGLPLVNADNVLEVVAELGIRPMPIVSKPINLQAFLKSDLNEEQRESLKYIPQISAVSYKTQHDDIWTGFVTNGMDSAVVFAMLPGEYVILVAEFKHGSGLVHLTLPGGKIDAGECPAACAMREFKQETGLTLESVQLLEPDGFYLDSRRSNERAFLFIGKIEYSAKTEAVELDDGEFLQAVAVPLTDWIKLADNGYIRDCSAVMDIYLILRKLGRLAIK